MGTLKNNASLHFYYSGYMETRIWRDFNAFLMEDSSHAKCKICVKGGLARHETGVKCRTDGSLCYWFWNDNNFQPC